MIWYYDKISEDEGTVVYAYAWENKKTTGRLKYRKDTDDLFIEKVADGDTPNNAKRALPHFMILIREGFPQHRVVQIG